MLTGRHIAITGATRGLGRAIAIACARRGAHVAVGHRASSARLAEIVVEEIRAQGSPAARCMELDVTDPAAAEAAVEALRDAWGRIDGWVNNAAVVRPELLLTSHLDRIDEQVATNLLGPIWSTRAVLPVMVRQRAGVILNIGSVAAAEPVRGQAVYAATKGALESFTRALAEEYGRKGIRALCLRPGPIDTEMLAPTRELARGRVDLHPLDAAVVAERAVELLAEDSVPNGSAPNGSVPNGSVPNGSVPNGSTHPIGDLP